MSDVVVTVPMGKWAEWLDEGDLARDVAAVPRGSWEVEGAAWEGRMEYGFTMGAGASRPDIGPGERVYVVAHGRLPGWSPFEYFDSAARFGDPRPGSWAIVRRGGAVACTIAAPICGFQGWRRRWWDRDDELAFPDWRTAGVR